MATFILMVKKLTNMTTIYETYLERVKITRSIFQVYDPEFVDEIVLNLRQSFIAMVEGRIQLLKNSIEKTLPIILSDKDVDYMYSLAQFNKMVGYNLALEDQISRLESELIKLKEN